MATGNTEYYDQAFYQNRHEHTRHAARQLLGHVIDIVPPIHAAVDVGCGVGTWLAALQEHGVSTLQGYDGDWVDPNLLEIPADCFESRELTQIIPAPANRYGLAMSLEVAEHLPASAARTFINSLTNQSDFVLFSAAIPHQGGRHHVNEQWLEYWVELFRTFNYIGIDALRPALWHDDQIQTWYRQNAVLFIKQSRLADIRLNRVRKAALVSQVHPSMYEQKIARYEARIQQMQTLKGSWKLLRRALKARLRR